MDDFDDGDFTDDPLEDNCESEDLFDDTPKTDDESQEDSSSTADDFFIGSAIGFGYEDGLDEAKRRKLAKELQDDMDDFNED